MLGVCKVTRSRYWQCSNPLLHPVQSSKIAAVVLCTAATPQHSASSDWASGHLVQPSETIHFSMWCDTLLQLSIAQHAGCSTQPGGLHRSVPAPALSCAACFHDEGKDQRHLLPRARSSIPQYSITCMSDLSTVFRCQRCPDSVSIISDMLPDQK